MKLYTAKYIGEDNENYRTGNKYKIYIRDSGIKELLKGYRVVMRKATKKEKSFYKSIDDFLRDWKILKMVTHT